MKCEDCSEWEYFEGYGHGCFVKKTMVPIDADKCEHYRYRWALRKNHRKEEQQGEQE